MVHVMNGCSKDGCQDLQISEDGLHLDRRKKNKEMSSMSEQAKQGKVLGSVKRPVLSMCHPQACSFMLSCMSCQSSHYIKVA